MTLTSTLGLIASTGGVLLGLAPIMQIRLIVARQSSEGVSIGYWAILLVAMGVWLAYGVALGNAAMIVPNAVSCTVAVAVMTVAWRYRPPALAASDPLTESLHAVAGGEVRPAPHTWKP